MAFNYDKLYSETPNALGSPTDEFVRFFDELGMDRANVLDVGCGQGRDALFISRLGHQVTGVDLSPHGIRDLELAAQKEDLNITGIVADLAEYTPDRDFDVILIDRTLHMLSKPDRLDALARLIDHVAPNGWLLIADEASNMKDFDHIVMDHHATWTITYQKRGYLFCSRDRG
ncbi:class I SAM-dependent methyltransferase [Aliiroseovarius sp. F20344]|uniref:class I SAM-dependent methyltransferase n=1 Tax=Aliiroseovarius sp. F20344 TaxID=2926414 RepID=UPI001FF1DBB6|nr:class I SAM-dependent methyltransferase [Aliiroseovarius sp. F20344]MCK0143808.1 class I SAM-dependent methyltransferase [Aliiroseovarius sp. F20344]